MSKVKSCLMMVVVIGAALLAAPKAYAGGLSYCNLGPSTGTNVVPCDGSGTGTVYGIEFSSPTIPTSQLIQAACFDTDRIDSIAATTTDLPTTPQIITGWVDTTKLQPLSPRPYTVGLRCLKSVATGIARVLFLAD